jgi:Zn-finger nucleic acid-binding protein
MFLVMEAQTLNCPMCGAPQSPEAALCDHCGARLETVACPSCFGMVFAGAKFCSHCGGKIERTVVADAKALECPRCRGAMDAIAVGNTNLRECPHCEGIWVAAEVLQQICADREQQSAVLGMAAPLPAAGTGDFESNIRYVPCPECNTLMNRVNFAHCSNVIVNVCAQHGTWFDKDELRRIIAFIRAGGLEKERARELEEIQQEKQQLKSAPIPDYFQRGRTPSADLTDDILHAGISIAAGVLTALFRK